MGERQKKPAQSLVGVCAGALNTNRKEQNMYPHKEWQTGQVPEQYRHEPISDFEFRQRQRGWRHFFDVCAVEAELDRLSDVSPQIHICRCSSA